MVVIMMWCISVFFGWSVVWGGGFVVVVFGYWVVFFVEFDEFVGVVLGGVWCGGFVF